jgi:hypothetical protein
MTTHYMDEAERCHRLAFIFRGALLDVGTPPRSSSADICAPPSWRPTDRWRRPACCGSCPRWRKCPTSGRRCGWPRARAADPAGLITPALEAAALAFRNLRPSRVTVEDAFVAMVRADERATAAREAA